MEKYPKKNTKLNFVYYKVDEIQVACTAGQPLLTKEEVISKHTLTCLHSLMKWILALSISNGFIVTSYNRFTYCFPTTLHFNAAPFM